MAKKVSGISITEVLTVTINEKDIREIVADYLMEEHNIHVVADDLEVIIEGGRLDNSGDHYSGGRISSTPTVIPPVFKGFKIKKESKR